MWRYLHHHHHTNQTYRVMAISQKPISLRISKESLARIDQFCEDSAGLRKRNEVINTAITEWLDAHNL